jgi:hypothetical protein
LAVGNDGSIFNDGVPVFSETTDLIIDPARRRPAAEEPAGQPHRSAYECLQLSRPALEMRSLSSG